jgi:hypothetical protein
VAQALTSPQRPEMQSFSLACWMYWSSKYHCSTCCIVSYMMHHRLPELNYK